MHPIIYNSDHESGEHPARGHTIYGGFQSAISLQDLENPQNQQPKPSIKPP